MLKWRRLLVFLFFLAIPHATHSQSYTSRIISEKTLDKAERLMARWRPSIVTIDVEKLSVEYAYGKIIEEARSVTLSSWKLTEQAATSLRQQASLSDAFRFLDRFGSLCDGVDFLGRALEETRSTRRSLVHLRELHDAFKELSPLNRQIQSEFSDYLIAADALLLKCKAGRPSGLPDDLSSRMKTYGLEAHEAFNQGRYEDAEKLWLLSLVDAEKVAKTEMIAGALERIAAAQWAQNKLKEAHASYERCIAILEGTAGLEKRLVTALENYAAFLRAEDRSVEAEKLELGAKAVRQSLTREVPQ